MRRRMLTIGAGLALAGLLLPAAPAAPASASTSTLNVVTPSELRLAFDDASGEDRTIALGATFSVSAAEPLRVPLGAVVTLDLNGNSLTVTGAPGQAGIGVHAGSTLRIIDGADSEDSELTAIGGAGGAGLGGERGSGAGTILIDGAGRVTATGGPARPASVGVGPAGAARSPLSRLS